MSLDIKSQQGRFLRCLNKFSLSRKETCFSSFPTYTFPSLLLNLKFPGFLLVCLFEVSFPMELQVCAKVERAVQYSSGQLWPNPENDQLVVSLVHLLQETVVSRGKWQNRCTWTSHGKNIYPERLAPHALQLGTGRSRRTHCAESQSQLLYWKVGRPTSDRST